MIPDPAAELTIAAHQYVESMVARADVAEPHPLWHGWALREAYIAGAQAPSASATKCWRYAAESAA